MSYDENNKIPARIHSLNMEARERLSLTGVDDVKGFDENLVILTTSLGDLNIRGQELHIEKIDLESGALELRGKIQELSYDESLKSGSVWKRLFG